jgi:DNA polymerase III subunit beta
MRLVIERGELLRALGHVTSVVERRTTIPILSNVMLKATGTTLEFKATDLEREVIENAPADVSQPGAVTVPAHMLHDIVRKLPDGAQVELLREPERERLTLSSGQSRFALQTLAAEDFPDLAVGEMTHEFEVGAADLKNPVCHFDRGNPLLPQRHLFPYGQAR